MQHVGRLPKLKPNAAVATNRIKNLVNAAEPPSSDRWTCFLFNRQVVAALRPLTDRGRWRTTLQENRLSFMFVCFFSFAKIMLEIYVYRRWKNTLRNKKKPKMTGKGWVIWKSSISTMFLAVNSAIILPYNEKQQSLMHPKSIFAVTLRKAVEPNINGGGHRVMW